MKLIIAGSRNLIPNFSDGIYTALQIFNIDDDNYEDGIEMVLKEVEEGGMQPPYKLNYDGAMISNNSWETE